MTFKNKIRSLESKKFDNSQTFSCGGTNSGLTNGSLFSIIYVHKHAIGSCWNTLCVYALLNDARIFININILSMSA